MYSSTASNSSETSTDSRMAVADILSSMANPIGDPNIVTSYSSLDGYTSGIPTRTTPTLTPTTLKNIEEFIELQSVPPEPIKHQHQAGFVPPLVSVPTTCSNFYNMRENSDNSDADNSMDEKSNLVVDQSINYQHSTEIVTNTSTTAPSTSKPRSTGRMGGRRPNNNAQLTPEEAERREMRRERNKLAAARCRKRRLDHTNILVQETECLEDERQSLQNEIQMLECQKEELRFILEAHKATCRINVNNVMEDLDVKTSLPHVTNTNNISQPSISRPTSLPVTSQFISPQVIAQNSANTRLECISEVAGVSITTPSNGIFNFESYMEGGTGFTPVSSSGITPVIPSCSTQQRNSSSDLSSPETVNPPKLVSL